MAKYETLGRMMSYNTTLKMRCSCGHEAAFSCKDAFTLFGEDATPFDIRRQLRCSKCQKVGKVQVSI